MIVRYKPSFIREFRKLPTDVQEEAKEKIESFKESENHERLRVYKLKGKLKDFYSFSVTYSHRIVFAYENKQTVVFIAIGSHDIYK